MSRRFEPTCRQGYRCAIWFEAGYFKVSIATANGVKTVGQNRELPDSARMITASSEAVDWLLFENTEMLRKLVKLELDQHPASTRDALAQVVI